MANKRKFSSSVLVRLQILFLLVMLPIFLTGVLFLSIGQSMLDEQLISILSQQLEFNINEIDSQMRGVKESAMHILTSAKTLRLTGIPHLLKGYTFATAVNDLEASLTQIRNQYAVVDHMELFMPKLSRTINTDGQLPNYADMDESSLISPLITRRYQAL